MDIGLVKRSVLKILANHELFLILFAFQFVLIFKDACQNFNTRLNLLRVDASKSQNQTLRLQWGQCIPAQWRGGDIEKFGSFGNFNFGKMPWQLCNGVEPTSSRFDF